MLVEQIINKINETVEPIIEKYKISRYQFIKKLKAECNEIDKKTRNSYENYEQKKQKGYTKSIRKYFNTSDNDLKEMINKDAKVKLFNIEKAVYKKLKGVEVNSVELIQFSDFYGAWLINNSKKLSYEFIIAGGYNIQCLHFRMIIKYK